MWCCAKIKRDFIFVVQCRHIQKRPYGRTPSAVLRQRLGPKTVPPVWGREWLSRWLANDPEIRVSRML